MHENTGHLPSIQNTKYHALIFVFFFSPLYFSPISPLPNKVQMSLVFLAKHQVSFSFPAKHRMLVMSCGNGWTWVGGMMACAIKIFG
jgi:hypothetical protein